MMISPNDSPITNPIGHAAVLCRSAGRRLYLTYANAAHAAGVELDETAKARLRALDKFLKPDRVRGLSDDAIRALRLLNTCARLTDGVVIVRRAVIAALTTRGVRTRMPRVVAWEELHDIRCV